MLPTGPLTPDAYLRERVRGQLEWYRDRGRRHERNRVRLATLIFAANVLAAVAAGVALFVQAVEPWVSVVTTLVGVLTTYAALTAADFLANSYGATARQLEELERAWRGGEYGGDDGFRRFVWRVEQVISREHSGWTAVVRHVSERDS